MSCIKEALMILLLTKTFANMGILQHTAEGRSSKFRDNPKCTSFQRLYRASHFKMCNFYLQQITARLQIWGSSKYLHIT